MKKIFGTLIILAIVAGVGGFVWLAVTDAPPPTEAIEQVIPNERFQR
jgi:hypothetical protein